LVEVKAARAKVRSRFNGEMAIAMVLNAASKGPNVAPNQLTRSLERILEDAQISGDLNLSGKKLKEFPKSRKEYNLSDTVNAGESRPAP
jgi:hypothetical protein